MTDWLLGTLVATTALIALVLLIREPVRRHFGARVAYGLWLIPAARLLMPTLTHTVERPIVVSAPPRLMMTQVTVEPMRLAREAGRQAVERSFALPLQAAGFDNAKVIARYPTEGSPVTKPLDQSRAYNDVLDEARSH